MKLSEKIANKLNSPFINRIMVKLGIDAYFKRSDSYWQNYGIQSNKSNQEIAGFSHSNDVQEAIDNTHKQLNLAMKQYLKKNDLSVLDIGCGPGLYLMDFPSDTRKYGMDINTKMLELAKKNNPSAVLFEGEFMKLKIAQSFDLIYCISVLQYFTPGELDSFFRKISSLLNPNGIVFINYPHATNKEELSYPDMNYICYSPSLLSKIASSYFAVIQNKHVLDDRSIDDYDHTPYTLQNSTSTRTHRNTSNFISMKKDQPLQK